jgi:hypothetical protein
VESRLNPSLVTPKKTIPLLEGPILMLSCPIQALLLVYIRERWLPPPYSSAIALLV